MEDLQKTDLVRYGSRTMNGTQKPYSKNELDKYLT